MNLSWKKYSIIRVFKYFFKMVFPGSPVKVTLPGILFFGEQGKCFCPYLMGILRGIFKTI